MVGVQHRLLRHVVDGAITPFEADEEFYDTLVLRAGEEETVWFEFRLATQ